MLDAGAGAVGYMTAAIGVGGLLGAFGAMTLEGRRLAVAFGLALVFWGAPIILIASKPQLAGAVALLAVVGAANSVEDVAVFTLLQRIVPDEQLTRGSESSGVSRWERLRSARSPARSLSTCSA